MKEEQNITIRIGGQPPVSMTVNRADEEIIRKAERGVNELFDAWRKRFNDKSSEEVMSMVAFQFARAYMSGRAVATEAAVQLREFEDELDRLLAESTTPTDV